VISRPVEAGGFPGFDSDGFIDVDVLFLTGATNDKFESAITEALGTAISHAHSGSRTLVTASGLVGPQIAYLLTAITAEYDLHVPIRVVGQVAKLYDELDYECDHVTSIPEFGHTDECLESGVITIAGPDVPREQSSGRLFGVLQEDPNACVVQLIGSGKTPRTTGQCTIHTHTLSNHPTRETLVEVHEAIDPTETVITHRHHGAKEEFNDLSGVVWGSGILMNTFSMTAHSGVSRRGWVAVLCLVMRVVISSSSLGPAHVVVFCAVT